MLLIGDLHLSSKIKSQVLDELKWFVNSHPEEGNIIFLGDYVYHFSYDRKALLELFQLFLEFYRQGKNLYILSGNHDWLGDSFVFEEGKRVFDLLEQNKSLKFITSPLLTEIENEKILFLPFCLNLNETEYSCYELGKTPLTESLQSSKEKNEIFSGKLNQLVNGFIKQEEKLTIVHHYYINKQKFPGYRSTFAFKDIALSEQLLDNPDITLISGHLHAPFVYNNYLCTGSVWPTTSLESNQLKGMFKYSRNTFSFYGSQPIHYIETENVGWVKEMDIQSLYMQYTEDLKNIFNISKHLQLMEFIVPELPIKDVSLTLKVNQLDYEKIDEVLDPSLREKIVDYRLKKDSSHMDVLLEKLGRPDEEKLQTFGGWHELLKEFLKTHYPDEYDKYVETLRDLKVI